MMNSGSGAPPPPLNLGIPAPQATIGDVMNILNQHTQKLNLICAMLYPIKSCDCLGNKNPTVKEQVDYLVSRQQQYRDGGINGQNINNQGQNQNEYQSRSGSQNYQIKQLNGDINQDIDIDKDSNDKNIGLEDYNLNNIDLDDLIHLQKLMNGEGLKDLNDLKYSIAPVTNKQDELKEDVSETAVIAANGDHDVSPDARLRSDSDTTQDKLLKNGIKDDKKIKLIVSDPVINGIENKLKTLGIEVNQNIKENKDEHVENVENFGVIRNDVINGIGDKQYNGKYNKKDCKECIKKDKTQSELVNDVGSVVGTVNGIDATDDVNGVNGEEDEK